MIKNMLCIACLAMTMAPGAVQAAELSPWMGNEGQAPFQLDPNTMIAVTFAADPLQTGSTTKPDCKVETCAVLPKTANTQIVNP